MGEAPSRGTSVPGRWRLLPLDILAYRADKAGLGRAYGAVTLQAMVTEPIKLVLDTVLISLPVSTYVSRRIAASLLSVRALTSITRTCSGESGHD